MRFNVKDSDVIVDKSDTSKPTTKLDQSNSQVVGSVSDLTIVQDKKVVVNPSITWMATISVGTLSPDVVTATDWSFGFIQAISLGRVFISWSGAKSIEGNITLDILNDTGRTYPDFDNVSPKGRTAAPWTKVRNERFKYNSATGKIACDTSDGPGFHIPTTIRNFRTAADNYIDCVYDTRTICCALVAEDQKETPKMRFIGHSIWDISLKFNYKWVKGNITSTSSSKVKISEFKFGPPDDPDLKKMLDPSFLTRQPYNDFATEELNRNIKALVSDKKTESDTWSLALPKDFFTP